MRGKKIHNRLELYKWIHIWLSVKKAPLYRYVFSLPLKVVTDVSVLKLCGREFHRVCPAWAKACSPIISLKPELAKDQKYRILRFVRVGSCESKIYCNWGKFHWQYERAKRSILNWRQGVPSGATSEDFTRQGWCDCAGWIKLQCAQLHFVTSAVSQFESLVSCIEGHYQNAKNVVVIKEIQVNNIINYHDFHEYDLSVIWLHIYI